MAIKKKKVAKKPKSKTKKKSKINLVKRSSIKNKKIKMVKKTIKINKTNNNRERGKMSTETVKSGRSPLLDTSHLKVPFPFKKKYGNFIGGKFVEPKSGKYFGNVSQIGRASCRERV